MNKRITIKRKEFQSTPCGKSLRRRIDNELEEKISTEDTTAVMQSVGENVRD